MRDIPVPTLDQITGRTVMEKMRTLAKAFIAFANEIKDNVYTEEQVRDYVTSVLLNYYTKEEVDEAIAAIDLSDFYTKSETDGMLALKRNIADSYNKTETDNLLNLKRDISDSYSKTEIDTKEDNISDRIDYLEENKQNILTPISPIVLDSDSISLKGFSSYTATDWTSLIRNNSTDGFYFAKDVYLVITGYGDYGQYHARVLFLKDSYYRKYNEHGIVIVADRSPEQVTEAKLGFVSVPLNSLFVVSTNTQVSVYEHKLNISVNDSGVITIGFSKYGNNYRKNSELKLYVRD